MQFGEKKVGLEIIKKVKIVNAKKKGKIQQEQFLVFGELNSNFKCFTSEIIVQFQSVPRAIIMQRLIRN